MNSSMAGATFGEGGRSQRALTGTKVLRVCVVDSGRVVDERRLKPGESLTIGQSSRNTFCLPDPSLPKSHVLFAYKSGQYELVVSEGMRGLVSVENRPIDLVNLKAQGLLKAKGDFLHLPLTDSYRGKVIVGQITLIFQFVVMPVLPKLAKLPSSVRGSIWRRVDWPHTGIVMALLAFEMPAVAYLHTIPEPKPVTLEQMDERWAKLIVPERKKQELKPAEGVKGQVQSESTRKAAKKAALEEPTDEEGKARVKAARTAKIRESIQGRGILAVLGSTGAGSASGAVADVFGDGGIGGDLDAAFEGIAGVGLATTGSESTTRGGGTGDAATIGGLATAGGGKVGLGGKRETRLASVDTAAPEVDGALDSEAIARVVQARKRMVQECYERELKRDPKLSGRIEIEITIDESGRVIEARVSSNKMGSQAVGDCIVARIRGWRFPKPDGGSVTANFPFIFTSSS